MLTVDGTLAALHANSGSMSIRASQSSIKLTCFSRRSKETVSCIESIEGLMTTVPLPGRTSTSPRWRRTPNASRRTFLLTLNLRARSRSDGSLSPGLSLRETMRSRLQTQSNLWLYFASHFEIAPPPRFNLSLQKSYRGNATARPRFPCQALRYASERG